MTAPSTILFDPGAHGIFTLTLNRPEKGNAFNPAMLAELGAGLAAIAQDPAIRVLVLRAKGRHFCTGADVSASRDEPAHGRTLNDILALLDTFPKPSIGVVQGGCVGGGIGFAACCDVLLATDDAFFSVPELRIGIAPSPQFAGLLVRAMGMRMMRRYGLSGERISAVAALAAGFVHEIVAADALESRLKALSDCFLHGAPGASAEFKQTLAKFALPPGVEIFGGPRTSPGGLERSPEATEGIAAFREKRKPSWYPK